jgi:hypothetical protein
MTLALPMSHRGLVRRRFNRYVLACEVPEVVRFELCSLLGEQDALHHPVHRLRGHQGSAQGHRATRIYRRSAAPIRRQGRLSETPAAGTAG